MNWYKRAQQSELSSKDRTREDEEYDAMENYINAEQEERNNILREFNEARKRRKAKPNTQPWPLIPAARLTKIWNDYSRDGIVRDEGGMDEIADRVVKNTARLAVNTELVGHTQVSPYKAYPEDFEYHNIKEKDMGRLQEFIQEDKYSDFALAPLQKIVFDLLKARTAEEKLLLVDQALNVIHQRGDVAAIFVEGGRKTLDKLFLSKVQMSANL